MIHLEEISSDTSSEDVGLLLALGEGPVIDQQGAIELTREIGNEVLTLVETGTRVESTEIDMTPEIIYDLQAA